MLDLFLETLDTNGENRSPSPAIAEACHSNALKRKSQPDFNDSEGRCIFFS